MKTLTSAQLFAAPKKAHKTKAWLERAKLVVVAARERAAETARYAAQPSRPIPIVDRPIWTHVKMAGEASCFDALQSRVPLI